jgi:meso-butanediol dehydrogenase / (S,S)-butanediol dehydrogenase / diacetyl reductase
MGRFEDKVVFLTGAASGIGRAVAVRLATEGATVSGMDVNEAGLAETGVAVEAAGGRWHATVGDVRSREVCHGAVQGAVDTHGRLDVLGNIAGIARAEHVLDVSEERFHQMMDVNVAGVLWCAQAAIPHLLLTGGNIVNIASNAGVMGQAYTVVYCASKGAVVNMTRALAMEFVKENLRVNAIAPGGVSTALTAGFEIPPDVDFELMARYTGFRPMAVAEDIANLFAFVASDEARNVHGAILSCDAGVSAG